ncbi:MAG: hypothetical protein NXI22_06955 [bacterium]|nr:hypothetical protein [bacterium]
MKLYRLCNDQAAAAMDGQSTIGSAINKVLLAAAAVTCALKRVIAPRYRLVVCIERGGNVLW